jgi:hypothetical protein
MRFGRIPGRNSACIRTRIPEDIAVLVRGVANCIDSRHRPFRERCNCREKRRIKMLCSPSRGRGDLPERQNTQAIFRSDHAVQEDSRTSMPTPPRRHPQRRERARIGDTQLGAVVAMEPIVAASPIRVSLPEPPRR